MLVLIRWHVGPGIEAVPNSGMYVILSYLVLFIVPEDKVQWDFCILIYYEFLLVLVHWHVGPGIEEVTFRKVCHTVLYFLFVVISEGLLHY